jgi:hypothetical protein
MIKCLEKNSSLRPDTWGRSIIPALRRLKQEAWKFKISLGHMVIPCLKKTTKRKSQLFFFLIVFAFAHICIHCLGHSPPTPPTSAPPHPLPNIIKPYYQI